jgi:radical SAM protein with 4Fe4S-binding SPASM domain
MKRNGEMVSILKRKLLFRNKQGLKAINLSLSLECGANCIFCPPAPRAKTIKQRIMSLEYVDRIINEIVSERFMKKHHIESMSISQNGDAFLNKEILGILRLIKRRAPHIRVRVFTNFSNLTKELSEVILGENLIREFNCNIDGCNEINYFNVKKLNLNVVKSNLTGFLETRKRLNRVSPLTIQVLTLHNYIHTVYKYFGFYPCKLDNQKLISVPDDFNLIKEQYEKIIDLSQDRIIESPVFAWAEREKLRIKDIDYSKYTCPLIKRVREEAFIAPDGSWYACCYDAQNELILGNVLDDSIDRIFNSKKRKKLIKLLEEQRFSRIDGPCRTVPCCQDLPVS